MSKKLKAMGLALIVVCAFGVASAAGAQGAVPEFTVEGVAAGVHAPLAEATTVTPAGGDYTFTVANLLRITCSEAKLDEAFVINTTGEGTAKSVTLFGCSVRTTTGGTTTCKVQGGTPEKNGEIHSEPVIITLKTVGTKHIVTFEPESGTTFATIKITECALAVTAPVTGTIGAEVLAPASGVLATNIELESSAATQTTGGDSLFFGARAATLDGKVDVHLASDGNWGVDW